MKSEPTEQTYFTKHEAAAYVRHSERTLDAAKAAGDVPFYRCGARKVLFKRSDLDKWLASMRVEVRGAA
jgi:excisionase family DNA binding protein